MGKHNEHKVRIIGGQWRGRTLPVVEQQGLRPTPDRVRETVFNWLQSCIPGACCLDLFAGSGVLGFEAASRGANEVILIENQHAACKMLNENIKALKAENMKLIQQDAIEFLHKNNSIFDVVFLDPPYESDLLAQSCRLLEDSQKLSDGAHIYIEQPGQYDVPQLPENWQIIRGKKAGQVGYYLAIRE